MRCLRAKALLETNARNVRLMRLTSVADHFFWNLFKLKSAP